MKKSILALGAAAALGGLGFAGTAHAVAYFGDGGVRTATAAEVRLTPGAVGHMLFTPYYSTAGSNGTLFNITNTDGVNGKAVKVRFRGAANSDDVLDFTLFLSPGDVWSASVTAGPDGRAQISTADKSCTIPGASEWPATFSDLRLPAYISEEAKTANMNEGYIEVLNMADIPPTLLSDGIAGTVTAGLVKGKANPIYTNIKHVAGVAPCSAVAFQDLLSTDVAANGTVAEGYGLAAPTGGLMGSWALFNQSELAVYSGNMTAVTAALGTTTNPDGVTPTPGVGYIAFAPQVALPIGAAVNVRSLTGDPLLASNRVTPLWFDLPDMSTPIATNHAGNAPDQASFLSFALGRLAVMNDYIATAAGAAVPMQTDWVVSQPTRRYHAAVSYGASAAAAAVVFNDNQNSSSSPVVTSDPSNNRYRVLTLSNTAFGPQACVLAGFGSTDREERVNVSSGSFSPGVTAPYCGEVFTVQFGNTSVLQAAVTKRKVTPVSDAGWASLTLMGANRLPIVGYAATSLKNAAIGGNYGMTLPHRWND